jgi:hypothetical protein
VLSAAAAADSRRVRAVFDVCVQTRTCSIKSCDPNTFGRYVTVSLPDDSYLTLCEVAVYANCQGTAAGAVTDGESHGDACEITLGAGRHSWADAEADCVSQGGHLTSIHSEEEKEAAAALGTQSW